MSKNVFNNNDFENCAFIYNTKGLANYLSIVPRRKSIKLANLILQHEYFGMEKKITGMALFTSNPKSPSTANLTDFSTANLTDLD